MAAPPENKRGKSPKSPSRHTLADEMRLSVEGVGSRARLMAEDPERPTFTLEDIWQNLSLKGIPRNPTTRNRLNQVLRGMRDRGDLLGGRRESKERYRLSREFRARLATLEWHKTLDPLRKLDSGEIISFPVSRPARDPWRGDSHFPRAFLVPLSEGPHRPADLGRLREDVELMGMIHRATAAIQQHLTSRPEAMEHGLAIVLTVPRPAFDRPEPPGAPKEATQGRLAPKRALSFNSPAARAAASPEHPAPKRRKH